MRILLTLAEFTLCGLLAILAGALFLAGLALNLFLIRLAIFLGWVFTF